MNDKIIDLKIADIFEPFRLKVKNEEDEIIVRKAAEMVNDTYRNLQSRSNKANTADLLAKVAVLFSRKYLEECKKSSDYSLALKDIEEELDDILLKF